ncbi:cytosine deaminase [Spirulina sp.]|uniref:cytosine deaminase n=1 Tax=Spirulina sp. TaxID=1157 RepID=UPI003F71956F
MGANQIEGSKMTDFDLIVRRARLWTDHLSAAAMDVGITGDRITAIEPHLTNTAPVEIDAGDQLVSAPFVESHIHLDSAMTVGEPRWNESGTLFEGIQIWGERKQSLTADDVQARALAALKAQASQGVLFVRTHVDVSEASLTALQAVLAVREAVRDWITVQVVAFPQDGLYGSPRNEALMEEAIALGVDVIGGIPHYELTREDGVRSVERIFKLATQHDRLIDLHCDEIDDEQSRFLEVMAACTLRSGLGDRVTASHTTAFGSYNNAYATKLMGTLRRAQLNIIANPLINITLQGRGDTYPKRRGITRVKELWQNGINVSLGNDCIQDPWYALGTGNMLDPASMAIHVCHMTGRAEMEACYDMVTRHGAKTLHLGDRYGLAVGKPANLICLAAIDPYDALRRRATITQVISHGRLLATTQPPQSQWHGA